MKPQVDKNLEQIYLNILIEKLQEPETWKRYQYSDKYDSTVILGTKTYFRTWGTSSSEHILDKITIRTVTERGNDDVEIHTLPLNKWRVKRLMRKLIEYMLLKEEWEKYEKIDNTLKKALPNNIDRYLKLTKIRKKL